MKVGSLVQPAPGCEEIGGHGVSHHGRLGIVCRYVKNADMWEIQWNNNRESGWWFEKELVVLSEAR